jgi:hypothetical protein
MLDAKWDRVEYGSLTGIQNLVWKDVRLAALDKTGPLAWDFIGGKLWTPTTETFRDISNSLSVAMAFNNVY